MQKNEVQKSEIRTELTTDEKAHQEFWKASVDVCKHLTTLSTGSILILVTFLEKLFANPLWKGLVAVAFIFFVVSIICTVMAMIHFTISIRDQGYIKKFDRAQELITFAAGFVCFIIGIVCLVIFAVKNLYG